MQPVPFSAHALSEQIRQAQAVLVKNPLQITSYLALGRLYQIQQRPDLALAIYESGLQNIPDSLELQELIGLLLTQTGHFAQAIKYLNSVRMARKSPAVLESLAVCLIEYESIPEALAVLEELKNQAPAYVLALILEALAHEKQLQYVSAIDAYELALRLEPPEHNPLQSAQIYHNLGNLYRQLGELEHSKQAYLKALKFCPDLIETRFNLELLLEPNASWQNRIQKYEYLLNSNQVNQAYLLCQMADVLSIHNQAIYAVKCLYQVLCLQPFYSQAWLKLANLFLDQGFVQPSRICFAYLLLIKRGQFVPAIKLQSSIHWDLNSPLNESICQQIFDLLGLQTLELDPVFAAISPATSDLYELQVLCALASIEQKQNNKQGAYELLQPLLKTNALFAPLILSHSKICFDLGASYDHEILPYLELVLAQRNLSQDMRRALMFQQAAIYDRQGDAARAFDVFVQANALRPPGFNPSIHKAETQALIQCLQADHLPLMSLKQPAVQPIFIVGMPRSGTTLTEQILCSHSQVAGGGELPFLSRVFRQLAGAKHELWSDKLSQASIEAWQAAADEYIRLLQLQAGSQNARFITDKMPSNIRFLGLIHILFPEAAIIHCHRHPLDICVSCFTTNFTHIDFTRTLDDLADYYLAYQSISSHWQSQSEIRVLDLHYDQMVQFQEQSTRQLLDFCGLDWEDACLNFHQQKRKVRTASVEQVNKPMYTSAINRYKKYETQLKPLMQRIGYESA